MILNKRPVRRSGGRRAKRDDVPARIGFEKARTGITTLKEINKVTFIEG